MDATLFRFRAILSDALAEQAGAAMEFPKPKKFDHGVQVGRYQGLEAAIELLDKLDQEDEVIDSRR